MVEMKEVTVTDPANRLIVLLSRGLSVAPHESYLILWQKAFGLPNQDIVEIHHRLDLLRDLIDEVERGIMQITDINHAVYLKPLPPLRQIISRVNLSEGWGSSKPILEMAINGLEFCSERLLANNPETIIKQQELDEIRKQVDDLITQLKSSETIPRKLRFVLFDLLGAVRRSIDEYLFRGTRGLRKELFVISAQLQENWNLIAEEKDKEEVNSFFKILSKIDRATAAALKVKQLLGDVAPYVPLLIQSASEHLGKL
jgi:hypothetical protein